MKNIILILLLSTFKFYSQNINFNEIKLLKDKKPIEVENFLKLKNWYLFSELMPTEKELGCVVFAMENERNDHLDFNKSRAFILYHFSKNFYVTEIKLMTSSESIYNSFKERLNELNYKMSTPKISENEFNQTYEGNDEVFKMSVFKRQFGEKYYTITLVNKKY